MYTQTPSCPSRWNLIGELACACQQLVEVLERRERYYKERDEALDRMKLFTQMRKLFFENFKSIRQNISNAEYIERSCMMAGRAIRHFAFFFLRALDSTWVVLQ